MEGKRRSFCEQLRRSAIEDMLQKKRKKVMQGLESHQKAQFPDFPDNMSVSTSSDDCVFGGLT
jgi:hypothetical protein